MHTEEHCKIEARGVAEGINPMFGLWQQAFEIEPVSYSNKRDKKDLFRTEVISKLKPNYVFYGDVEVQITLYLNEQKAEENPKYGDLDNYAKQILDCIKGSDGVIIDDCQVQTLGITWIDVPGDSHFEISVKGRPDEFMQKPLKLYEMPDKRYYPLSKITWGQTGLSQTKDEHMTILLRRLSDMILLVKKTKHEFRQNGANSLQAFRENKGLMPCLLGFHKSAVIDSGFTLVPRKEWNV